MHRKRKVGKIKGIDSTTVSGSDRAHRLTLKRGGKNGYDAAGQRGVFKKLFNLSSFLGSAKQKDTSTSQTSGGTKAEGSDTPTVFGQQRG